MKKIHHAHLPHILKIFAIFGFILVILLPVAVVLVAFFVTAPVMKKAKLSVPSDMTQELGALGSACGGKLSLPCSAGFTCKMMEAGSQADGVCVEASAVREENFSRLDEQCDEEKGTVCLPTLYCHHVATGNVCEKKDVKEAPHILSANFEGLQPTDAGYVGQSKTPILVTVTGVNAEKALIAAIGDGVVPSSSVTMTKTNGQFTASLTLEPGFAGRLIVLITSKDGSTNSLLKRIALVE